MPTDLQRELRHLGDAMLRTSEPISLGELDAENRQSTEPTRMHGDLGHEPDQGESRSRASRPWLAAAAVLLVVAGVTAVWAATDRTTEPEAVDQPTAPVSSVPSDDPNGSAPDEPTSDRTTSEQPVTQLLVDPIPVTWSETDQPLAPWNEVALSPGSIGWHEVDTAALPPELAERLGEATLWDPAYLMNFFRCPSWRAAEGSVVDGTLDASGVTCDQAVGGYRESVAYGDVLSVGTGTGRSDWTDNTDPTIETLLVGLADGSLWGYDTHDTPPAPTRHDVDGIDAVSYRSGDHTYLVMEPAPGTFVWLHGNGLSDTELETIARSLRPVDLPSSVPVPLILGPDIPHPSTNGSAQLKLVWLDGRPCVGLQIELECTPADAGPALVTGGTGMFDQQPAVAAIVPSGADYQLKVALFGIDEWQTVPRTFIGVGITTYVYTPTSERLFSARLADPSGNEIAAAGWGIESMINAFAPDLVAEGRTDGVAWVVVRQDPEWDGPPPSMVHMGGGYCLLLFEASGGFAPLCPPAEPPATGLGAQADYHDRLDLIEVAADITTLSCNGEPLDIITDDHLGNRRFAISTCANPTP